MNAYTLEQVLRGHDTILSQLEALRTLIASMSPTVQIARPPGWPPSIVVLVDYCQEAGPQSATNWTETQNYTKEHLTKALEQIEAHLTSVRTVVDWLPDNTQFEGPAVPDIRILVDYCQPPGPAI